MPASVENESEILLGNKQLLLVFAVVAVLLAVAFGAGYMLGKNSVDKKGVDGSQTPATTSESSGGPITQKVAPDEAQTAKTELTPPAPVPVAVEASRTAVAIAKPAKILGSRVATSSPQSGENYVQVAAVVRKVADATADVLRQHGFAVRVAAAPGNTGVFRVLVGPAKDAADLRNTEDKLRKIGYTKCFVQHY